MKEKVVLSYTKGITHSPSGMICPDGELEECVNMEVRNGELVPMVMPTRLDFSLEPDERLILVHNTKLGGKKYVTIKYGELRIFEVSGSTKNYIFSHDCGEVQSIQYIGNSIVAYTDNSPHYILYSNGGYKYLGTGIPDVALSFGLSGEFVLSETFKFSTPDTDSLDDEDFQSSVSQSLLAEVNKFVENESTAKGKFMFPFFVRYALRMFDGSYAGHSSPILMLPSTNIAPFVVSNAIMEGDNAIINKTLDAQVGAFVAQLKASVLSSDDLLPDWGDVISSVDIFVSRQIRTYEQDGKRFYSGWIEQEDEQSKFVGEYQGRTTIWDGYTQMKALSTVDVSEGYLHRWHIPKREAEDVGNEIANTSLFYKYSSISLNEVSVGNEMGLSGSLGSLEVEDTLTDDYMTHDTFIPDSTFVYNGRLNISSVRRKLFLGFSTDNMINLVKESVQDGFDYDLLFGRYRIYTFVKSSNGGSDIVVRSNTSGIGSIYGAYLFYPDSDAYKMVIEDVSNSRHAVIQLSEHPLLNGAFFFGGFQTLIFTSGSAGVSATDNTEEQLNKLYVSNVNNLFHFPLEGIYTVGSDRIIGISSITRPISQGQFGEFPLMAFCSDGNYALRVDEQGYYTGISPVQEDIVLGGDKITPMENSVMIITKKGLMITSGGDIDRIAIQMDGGVRNMSSLDGIKSTSLPISELIESSSDDTGFLSYVYGSRMAFDYASNRVLVFNPEKTYSYLYNFENDTVSKMSIGGGSRIVTSVIDYPDTIIQDEYGRLYSLYTKEDVSLGEDRRYGFVLTRPLKFGAALNMKSVKQVFLLSNNLGSGSYAKYILYGSNDDIKYYRLSSRFGKPYKFYRMAIYTFLLPKESLSGTALTVEERRTHKFR